MMANLRAHLDHPYVSENLSAYLDDEVSARDRARIERHLGVCDECQRELASLRQMVTLLHNAPVRPLPRSFILPRSAEPLQAQHRRWSLAFGTLRTAAVAVTFMLALLVSGDVLLSSGVIPLQVQSSSRPQVMMEKPAEKAVEETVAVEKEAAGKQGDVATVPGQSQGAPQAAQAPAPQQPAAAEQPSVAQAAPTAAAAPQLAPTEPAQATAPATGRAVVVPKTSGTRPEQGSGPKGGRLGPEMGGGVQPAGGMGGGPAGGQGAESPLDQARPSEGAMQARDAEQALAATAPEAEPSTEAPVARAVAPAATAAPSSAAVEAPEARPEQPLANEPLPLAQPRSGLWALWSALRLTWAALLGILLMLIAGVIWAGYKRRI